MAAQWGKALPGMCKALDSILALRDRKKIKDGEWEGGRERVLRQTHSFILKKYCVLGKRNILSRIEKTSRGLVK